jgi:hypothetical protein
LWRATRSEPPADRSAGQATAGVSPEWAPAETGHGPWRSAAWGGWEDVFASIVFPEVCPAHGRRSGHTGIPSISPAAEGQEQPYVKPDMITDTRRGPMKGVWLTELNRHHLHDLSALPWRHPPDGSLGLGGRWHVYHLGNIRLVRRRYGISLILATRLGDIMGVSLGEVV